MTNKRKKYLMDCAGIVTGAMMHQIFGSGEAADVLDNPNLLSRFIESNFSDVLIELEAEREGKKHKRKFMGWRTYKDFIERLDNASN